MHFLNALNDFYVLLQNLMPMINHRFHHCNLDNLKLVFQEGKKEDLNKKARGKFKCQRV